MMPRVTSQDIDGTDMMQENAEDYDMYGQMVSYLSDVPIVYYPGENPYMMQENAEDYDMYGPNMYGLGGDPYRYDNGIPDPNDWRISECRTREDIELEEQKNINFGEGLTCENIEEYQCCSNLYLSCDDGARINPVDICDKCRNTQCTFNDLSCIYPNQANNDEAEFWDGNCNSYLPENDNHEYCCDDNVPSCIDNNMYYEAIDICDGCKNVDCSARDFSFQLNDQSSDQSSDNTNQVINQQVVTENKVNLENYEETIFGLPITLFFIVVVIIVTLLLGVMYFIYIQNS